MPENQSSSQLRRLVVLFWILVAFFYFYLSYDYIRAANNDRAFNDYLQYVVQLAGNEHRPSKEVRALLMIKAGQLGIPLQDDHLSVVGAGQALEVICDYAVDIDLPGFERAVYHKVFQHDVRYAQQR